MRNFKEDFNQFINSRYVNIEDLTADPQYMELSQQSKLLYNEIKDALGPEKKDLLREFETVEGCLQGLAEERVYKIGLSDGIQLNKELNIVC